MPDKWLLVPKPKAVLELVDSVPIPRGDGATTQRWKTGKGVIFSRVDYGTGRVEWYQLVTT